MSTNKRLYTCPDQNNYLQMASKGTHREATKIIEGVINAQEFIPAEKRLDFEHIESLRKSLSIALHCRDQELKNRYGNLFYNLTTTAKMLDTTILDVAISKIVACVETLPTNQVKHILGHIEGEDTTNVGE